MTEPSIRPVRNPDGSPNIEVQGRLLHSKHNPLEEARRFLTPLLESLQENETLVILGVGAGYVVCALAELRPAWLSKPHFSGRALFVEPVPELLALPLELEPILAAHTVRLGSLSELKQRASGTVRIVSLPAHRNLFVDAHRTDSDESTRSHFFRLWTAGAIRRALGRSSYLTEDDIGAVCITYCGAGPALGRQYERAAGAELLAASDTALPGLIHQGILPDLVLSIDAGPGTLYHLRAAKHAADRRGFDLSELPVVAWSGAHRSLEDFFRQVWLYRTTFPLDQIADVPGADESNESRNTAGLALILARLWKIGQAEFLGTGYVSEGTVTHVPATGYDLYAAEQASRLRPAAGYRARSYGPELAGRNKQALQGLINMAARLGIKIQEGSTRARSRDQRQLKVKTVEFDGQIARNLLSNLPLIRQQFSKYGLGSRDFEKRVRQLRAAS